MSKAIDSILRQTLSDFELLIIDDGSTDETSLMLEKLADSRIRIHSNDRNIGVPATRNLGLEFARGEYLAMFDSDDISHPKRLETQVRFLDAHVDHAVVGSWAREIDENSVQGRLLRRPTSWKQLRASLLFFGTIRTSSAMGRMEVLQNYRFRSEFPVCSDSDFWVRVALDHRCTNLPSQLIDYRIHSDSLTKSNSLRVKGRKIAIARDLLQRLGVDHGDADLENHFRLRRPKRHEFDRGYIDWAEAWLRMLIDANRKTQIFPESSFASAAADRWARLLLAPGSPPIGRRVLRRGIRGPLLSHAFRKVLGRIRT